ncbi:MAG: class I SAM-dependent methyltransferase [Chloroflexales bacterium]|nr:class I SAM-dependent methyltransferase [Chloroflexales bacterium]
MATAYNAISSATAAHSQIDALPADVPEQIGAALAKLVTGSGYILDMGCGAGRIAVPAASTGIGVYGFDLDPAMVAETQHAADEGGLPLAVGCADITRLPLPGASVPAVLSVSVLHLVTAWERALDEAVRVLRPEGVLILGRDWLDPDSCAGRLGARLVEELGALRPELRHSAAADPAALAQALADRGGTSDPDLIVASWVTLQSPADVLGQMAARAHGETWRLDDALLGAALARLRAWAAETWPDLSVAEAVERRFVLSVTRGLR